jgi:hypothetical protein
LPVEQTPADHEQEGETGTYEDECLFCIHNLYS